MLNIIYTLVYLWLNTVYALSMVTHFIHKLMVKYYLYIIKSMAKHSIHKYIHGYQLKGVLVKYRRGYIRRTEMLGIQLYTENLIKMKVLLIEL